MKNGFIGKNREELEAAKQEKENILDKLKMDADKAALNLEKWCNDLEKNSKNSPKQRIFTGLIEEQPVIPSIPENKKELKPKPVLYDKLPDYLADKQKKLICRVFTVVSRELADKELVENIEQKIIREFER